MAGIGGVCQFGKIVERPFVPSKLIIENFCVDYLRPGNLDFRKVKDLNGRISYNRRRSIYISDVLAFLCFS